METKTFIWMRLMEINFLTALLYIFIFLCDDENKPFLLLFQS